MRNLFLNNWALMLLSLLPGLITLSLMAWRRRAKVLARLGRLPVLFGLAARGWFWLLLRGLSLAGGLVCLVLGIAGPQWGQDPQRAMAPGRDLVVVLDLSRSMLAEDVLPSRLDRARTALLELAEAVQRRGGHRLALVVFAARPRVICPLTNDYDHFREKVAEIDAEHLPREIRPGPEGPVSGTRIGAGLQLAVANHDPRSQGFQDILLLSDGDDPAGDREWLSGVNAARSSGIPVVTVGVGDPVRGGRIPFGQGFLNHDDEEVWTKLQEQPLEEIANRTGGSYLAARTEPPQLADWFRSYLEARERREGGEDAVPIYKQRYPWFFLPALALFAAAIAIPERVSFSFLWRKRKEKTRR